MGPAYVAGESETTTSGISTTVKEYALAFLFVCVVACISTVVGTSYNKSKQQQLQAIAQLQKATDDWNAFVASTNIRTTNEAYWHTNQTKYIVVGWHDESPGWLLGSNPCGSMVILRPGFTIPTNDVPCPCGNTNHWLWKFGKL